MLITKVSLRAKTQMERKRERIDFIIVKHIRLYYTPWMNGFYLCVICWHFSGPEGIFWLAPMPLKPRREERRKKTHRIKEI